MFGIHRLLPITEKPFAEWHEDEYGPRTVCVPAEVAKYLGVHTVTILRWLDEGILPGLRPSRTWILMVEDIDTWINEALTAQAARDTKK